MRGGFLLGALAFLLLAPLASAVTVVAERQGDALLVTVTADAEPAQIDLVVSHADPRGEVIDHVRPLDLAPRETVRFEVGGLPAGPSYAIYAARRGEVTGAPPSSGPTPAAAAPTGPPAPPFPMTKVASSLASAAQDGVVTVTTRPAFPAREGRSATVFAPGGDDLLVVRENVEGAVEAAISRDGGLTFGAPIALSPPAMTPGAVRVHWDETRFADGSVGVVYRQFEHQEPMDGKRDWTLVRLDLAEGTILARQTLAFDISQFIEGESMEIFTLPNGRTLLIAEAKDVSASYSIDSPSALRVWTLTGDGALVDGTRIPLAHGVLPRFETASTVDGIVRIAWTHGASQSDAARYLWTTTSTDGGATFSPPAATDLPFPTLMRPQLSSAQIDPDGTLHVAVVADDPTRDPGVGDAPFYVRVPLDGPSRHFDLRSIPWPASPGAPTLAELAPRVTATGDRIILQWTAGESLAVESLDGGDTFGPVLFLRDELGSPFFVTDFDLRADGAVIAMTTSERCVHCLGVVLQPDLLEMSPWFGGPIDLVHVRPPDVWGGPLPPPRHEPVPGPMRPTPGIAPIVALLAIAALARLAPKRSR